MKKAAMLLLTVLLHGNGISQTPNLNNLQFSRLSVKDGMPSDAITCALQDKEGYMWIGTQRGLVRYDGYKTTVYEFGTQELSRLNVVTLFEARSGQLWAGSAGNLYSYNRELDSFTRYEHDPANRHSISAGMVCAMQDDREGNLWLLISDGLDGNATHLNRLNPASHRFDRYDILEKSARYASWYGGMKMLEDSRGHLWFGTSDGAYEVLPAAQKFILHFASDGSAAAKTYSRPAEDKWHAGSIWMNVRDTKSGKWEGLIKYTTGNDSASSFHRDERSGSLDTDSVYTINKSADGRLFFGTENGLSILDSSSDGFINYPITATRVRPSDNQIWEFTEDSSHNIWCGNTRNLFVFREKERNFLLYQPNQKDPQSLKEGTNSRMLTDRSGTVWLQSFTGMYRINEKTANFVLYQDNPDRSHYFPGGGGTSFTEGKDGTIWIWSVSGLFRWNQKQDSFELIRSMSRRPEQAVVVFSSSAIDKRGRIWCNTFGNGLYCYDPETKETRIYRHNGKDSSSLCSDQVSRIFVDKSDVVWIGTFEAGLCSLNPATGRFRHYPFIYNKFQTPNFGALDDAYVMSIYEDAEGTIWAGTLIGGLNKFDRKSGHFTSYQDKLPGFTTLTSIFEDRQQQLWAATGVGGLFAIDRKSNSVIKYTQGNGLLYSGALGMNEDNAGNLWLTSPRGLSIVNEKTKRISTLGVANGLPELPEYNFNLFRTKEGKFLLPVENGFVVFDPKVLQADSTVPITHIESVSFRKENAKEHKETDSTILAYGKKEITLNYDENRISVEYVGLSYQNAALNKYKYRLEGYGNAWTDAGTERVASFGNLLPGRYIFHLQAANGDGIWNPEEAILTIVIRPPWWQTWWAYILYSIVAVVLLRGYIVYRSRHLVKQNQELEEKVATRTNELNLSLDHLKSTQQQLIQSEKMASLGELTAGIAHEIQNPLNFINNFSEINTEMIDEAAEEAAKGNIDPMKELLANIRENSAKIAFHGSRADSIVKGMLLHSRQSKGIKQPTDLNALCDEYLRLSYHGIRAKDKNFNCSISTDFDPSVGTIDLVPQDISRVLLNLFNNAFYAVNEKARNTTHPDGDDYVPAVTVRTMKRELKVIIDIKDNGNGIPKNILDKIFQPFFTTKPAGQGTGLGLSLAYDIITQGHNGIIVANSREGEGTTFEITLNA